MLYYQELTYALQTTGIFGPGAPTSYGFEAAGVASPIASSSSFIRSDCYRPGPKLSGCGQGQATPAAITAVKSSASIGFVQIPQLTHLPPEPKDAEPPRVSRVRLMSNRVLPRPSRLPSPLSARTAGAALSPRRLTEAASQHRSAVATGSAVVPCCPADAHRRWISEFEGFRGPPGFHPHLLWDEGLSSNTPHGVEAGDDTATRAGKADARSFGMSKVHL